MLDLKIDELKEKNNDLQKQIKQHLYVEKNFSAEVKKLQQENAASISRVELLEKHNKALKSDMLEKEVLL